MSSLPDVDDSLFWMDIREEPSRAAAVHVSTLLTKCPSCGRDDDNHMPDHDSIGHLVCACGQIRHDLLFWDTRPKFKHATSGKEEDMIKDECFDAFVDPTLPKSSMSIVMSHGGNAVFHPLRRLQNGYLTSDERAILSIMDTIRMHTDGRGYPTSVFHDAAILFRKLQERSKQLGDCTRGDVRRALIAACVFYCCRSVRVIKTQEEVAAAFQMTDEQFTKGWSRFIDICAHRGFSDLSLPPLLARDFLFRCSHALSLPWSVTQHALAVAEFVKRNQWSSNNTPCSLAGAILLLVAHARVKGTPNMDTIVASSSRPPTDAEWSAALPNMTPANLATTCSMSVMTLQKIHKELLMQWQALDTNTHAAVEASDTVAATIPPTETSRRNHKKRARLIGLPSLSSAAVL